MKYSLLALILVSYSPISFSATSSTTVFSWTDEAGVVHFTDKKPRESIVTSENLSTTSSVEISNIFDSNIQETPSLEEKQDSDLTSESITKPVDNDPITLVADKELKNFTTDKSNTEKNSETNKSSQSSEAEANTTSDTEESITLIADKELKNFTTDKPQVDAVTSKEFIQSDNKGNIDSD